MAIVTGANSGVEFETARTLARLGATVITLACRNEQKCQRAAEKIIQSDAHSRRENVPTLPLDISSLRSVKNFSKMYIESTRLHGLQVGLDMLFKNAGIGSAGMNSDGYLPLSEDDVEQFFATNHLGHYLLFRLLEPLLEISKMPRVVLTLSSSSFSTFPYKVATDLQTLNSVPMNSVNRGYLNGQSKLAQILFAKYVTARNQSLYINAFHPGAVDTGIWQKNPMFPD